MSPRMISRVTFSDVLAGLAASISENTTCAVIAAGMLANDLNGTKSLFDSSAYGVATTGRSRWLSAVARPWPGMCLMTGTTPPAINPSATSRAMSMICAGVAP